MTAHLLPYLSLDKLHRIKKWHVAHRADHPLEYQLWDSMLILWVIGRVGWLPAFALDAPWACPLCLLAMLAPNFYFMARARAHQKHTVRCDWLGA